MFGPAETTGHTQSEEEGTVLLTHSSSDDPKERLSRLFREADAEQEQAPFPDAATDTSPQARLRESLARIRRLRAQIGAEGLSPAATRTLLDEIVRGLEATHEALELQGPPGGAPRE